MKSVPIPECNCFEHADSCHYDEYYDQLNMSLNTAGEKLGGGVCDNCQQNTAGTNCEKCLPMFYRPVGVSQSQQDACQPCNCNMSGVTTNPETQEVGDCVINDDIARADGKVFMFNKLPYTV